jgi:hypothetical protein
MPELGPYGSVRGARGNSRPYRDSAKGAGRSQFLTQSGFRRDCDCIIALVAAGLMRSSGRSISFSFRRAERLTLGVNFNIAILSPYGVRI